MYKLFISDYEKEIDFKKLVEFFTKKRTSLFGMYVFVSGGIDFDINN
ncbi:conserved hypothetical protein (plasmid) [Bacillus cereus AH820]|jgi:hypothetical protein|uniref:Uncharacterized protein n=2 Tax=Bacillus cereus TaxID=1396 RepID=Q74NM7_BACC1|nr:hypothetical protein BCE_A0217 [Bacillus cereus ATCC 10987]ACK92819.1 conserved hypothetical protein [Bacillus cereus AH820]ADH10141.1 hypothetical protein BMB171_P0249 [Bacillus thuringiensis BMB171]EEK75713.1 hypothetical protein bcere0009_53860 [Bacillus cereus R309803]EEL25320.1 hypothetical protein bcere0018_56790 [Bacillus cereus Rock1-15]